VGQLRAALWIELALMPMTGLRLIERLDQMRDSSAPPRNDTRAGVILNDEVKDLDSV